MKKYIISDAETGEIIDSSKFTVVMREEKNEGVSKKDIDAMLERASEGEELDSRMLYNWCKKIGEINRCNQIKLNGIWVTKDYDEKVAKELSLSVYIARSVLFAHEFTGVLKENHKTHIESWKHLYELIGCNSRSTQIRLKNFLEKHGIIRTFKNRSMTDGKMFTRFVLNPFLKRGAGYSGEIGIILFQDFIKEGNNINTYPLRWLQSLDYIK